MNGDEVLPVFPGAFLISPSEKKKGSGQTVFQYVMNNKRNKDQKELATLRVKNIVECGDFFLDVPF